jgi:MoxR-like ATPase
MTKFKKSTGAPMCGRFGHVLGKPGASQEQLRKIAIAFGSKCDSNGDDLPPTPVEYRLQVALPDPSISVNPDADSSGVTTCGMCANYVPDRVISKDLGWATGLCAAKGKLILPSRQSIEARQCEFRTFGKVRENSLNVNLLPEYEDAFSLSADPVKAYFKKKNSNFVEPHEYPSDKEVDPADAARGIRGWFKVVDPDGSGNHSFLPIYDPEYFDATERAKIPRTGDDEHPELYVDHFGGLYLLAVTWRELDETPALWGEAGTGKTELFRHAAWRMCLPFERVSITAQTEIEDLIGKMKFSPEKGTYFEYGRLPLAWMKPCVLCLDEPNVGRPEVWQEIRPLTDNSKQLVIDQNEHERAPRHDDCYFGMAMNPGWDVRNVGTNQIGDADASRLFHIYMELPPEPLEREIIVNRVKLDGWEIDENRLNALMKIAVDIRALCKDDTLPITWGLRPQIKVARAMRWFDPVTAYRRAIADYLEPEAQEQLLDQVRAHIEGRS